MDKRVQQTTLNHFCDRSVMEIMIRLERLDVRLQTLERRIDDIMRELGDLKLLLLNRKKGFL